MRPTLQLLSNANRQLDKYLKYVNKDGPVPKGFKVASAATGVKKNGTLDLAIIVNTHESANGASAAAVFTTNKFQAAPVQLSKQILEKTKGLGINAVAINSGCANAVTGSTGMCDANTTAELVSHYVGKPNSTLLMSTGVIGQALQMDKITKGIDGIFQGNNLFGSTYSHWLTLATAIMTTDTFPKIVSDTFHLSDGSNYTMIGVAKGAGMICPNMATMLAFIGTDLPICPSALRSMLRYASDRSFNCISVDGDMSTNDTLYMMANGAVKTDLITEKSADYELIRDHITVFATRLARLIVRDGEGATKFVKVIVKNARNFADAKVIARTISNSMLVKCALYGQDANWGRILSAIGSVELTDVTSLEPKSLCVSLLPSDNEAASLTLLSKGEPDFSFDEERAAALLKETDINVEVDLGTGTESCEFYTCDLSHEYVSINGHYRS